MKTLNTKFLTILSIICFAANTTTAQSWCLKLDEVSNDGINYVVSLKIQGNQTFGLGSCNLQFTASHDALDVPNAVVSFQPFSELIYQPPTVTAPNVGEVSYNIEMGFPGTGYEVAAAPNWTEIGHISFPILDITEFIPFSWNYNGGTTGTVLFLEDEASQLFVTDPDCLQGIEVVGISNFENNEFGIEFYPNPTRDLLNIDFNSIASDKCNITIVDISGKTVYTENNIRQENSNFKQIELSHLNPGIYIVNLLMDDKIITDRISILK